LDFCNNINNTTTNNHNSNMKEFQTPTFVGTADNEDKNDKNKK